MPTPSLPERIRDFFCAGRVRGQQVAGEPDRLLTRAVPLALAALMCVTLTGCGNKLEEGPSSLHLAEVERNGRIELTLVDQALDRACTAEVQTVNAALQGDINCQPLSSLSESQRAELLQKTWGAPALNRTVRADEGRISVSYDLPQSSALSKLETVYDIHADQAVTRLTVAVGSHSENYTYLMPMGKVMMPMTGTRVVTDYASVDSTSPLRGIAGAEQAELQRLTEKVGDKTLSALTKTRMNPGRGGMSGS